MKTALITGAARGIGLATAKRFLKDGWQVAMLDIDGPAQVTAAEALKQPGEVVPLIADVAVEAQVNAAVDQVATRFGRLDALVNNAGTATFKPILDTAPAEWQRVLDVNLTGPYLCALAAVPLMTGGDAPGGAIVNIASISGVRASTLRVAYGTSKAALMHLTKQMAVEFAESVSGSIPWRPGRWTPRWPRRCIQTRSAPTITTLFRWDGTAWKKNWRMPSHFLCSDRASYITGQNLGVDGGFEATGIGLKTLRAPS